MTQEVIQIEYIGISEKKQHHKWNLLKVYFQIRIRGFQKLGLDPDPGESLPDPHPREKKRTGRRTKS